MNGQRFVTLVADAAKARDVHVIQTLMKRDFKISDQHHVCPNGCRFSAPELLISEGHKDAFELLRQFYISELGLKKALWRLMFSAAHGNQVDLLAEFESKYRQNFGLIPTALFMQVAKAAGNNGHKVLSFGYYERARNNMILSLKYKSYDRSVDSTKIDSYALSLAKETFKSGHLDISKSYLDLFFQPEMLERRIDQVMKKEPDLYRSSSLVRNRLLTPLICSMYAEGLHELGEHCINKLENFTGFVLCVDAAIKGKHLESLKQVFDKYLDFFILHCHRKFTKKSATEKIKTILEKAQFAEKHGFTEGALYLMNLLPDEYRDYKMLANIATMRKDHAALQGYYDLIENCEDYKKHLLNMLNSSEAEKVKYVQSLVQVAKKDNETSRHNLQDCIRANDTSGLISAVTKHLEILRHSCDQYLANNLKLYEINELNNLAFLAANLGHQEIAEILINMVPLEHRHYNKLAFYAAKSGHELVARHFMNQAEEGERNQHYIEETLKDYRDQQWIRASILENRQFRKRKRPTDSTQANNSQNLENSEASIEKHVDKKPKLRL